MDLSRVDLADLHTPKDLLRALHKQLGPIEPPIPVLEIARALGITDIRQDAFDGFEGMLLTDRVRSRGAILANTSRGHRRARFTTSHELGHFLLERHQLTGEAGLTCSARDMREVRVDQRHRKQEAEANEFAIGLLAPVRLVNPYLTSDPDLRDAVRLCRGLDVSLEAVVRRMIALRDECLAAVWSKDGLVRYAVRKPGFPWISCKKGERMPEASEALRVSRNGEAGITEFAECHPLTWTDRPDGELFEQTRIGSNGHAVTLLWLERDEVDEDDEDGAESLGSPRFR